MRNSTLVLAALCLFTLVFQVTKSTATPLSNFSPVAALFLCSGLFRDNWKLALGFPLATLLASDLILSGLGTMVAPFMLVRYAVYLLLFLAAWRMRGAAGWQLALGMSAVGALVFYVATNTVVWLDPASLYAKSFAGWWQCLTTGDPRFAPTFLFFRNTLLGDMGFAVLFAVALGAASRRDQPLVAGHRLPA